GGAGADTMAGGAGDDTYYADTSDTITENAGEGTDTSVVEYVFDYTLGANVENLTLLDWAINGRGNELDNTLSGNDWNNLLFGYAGNDVWLGGNGNDEQLAGAGTDTMAGGAGNDTFLFAEGDFGGASTTTADEITDFTVGQDTIDLTQVDANTLLSGDQAFAFVGTAAFSGATGELRYEQISGNTY